MNEAKPRRIPSHPGEILTEKFLAPLACTQVAFAKHLSVPALRINEIVRGKRGTTWSPASPSAKRGGSGARRSHARR